MNTMTQEETIDKLIAMYDIISNIENKVNELLKQKETAENNFIKAKAILNDIMKHFEFHAILSEFECKEIMSKYMEE